MNTRKYLEKLNGDLNIVGKKIKKTREKEKLSRQQLSDKLMFLSVDISAQSIFDIENGVRTVIDYELCAIAKVLNVSTDFLLQDFKNYLDNI